MALGSNTLRDSPAYSFENPTGTDNTAPANWGVSTGVKHQNATTAGLSPQHGTYSCLMPAGKYASLDKNTIVNGLRPGRQATISVYMYDKALCDAWEAGAANKYATGADVRGSDGKDYTCIDGTQGGTNDPVDVNSNLIWQPAGITLEIDCFIDTASSTNAKLGYRPGLLEDCKVCTAANAWEQKTFSYKIPSNAVSYKLLIVNAYGTKSVWIDTASVVMDNTNQLRSWLINPPTENKLTQEMGQIAKIGYEVHTTEALKTAGTTQIKVDVLNYEFDAITQPLESDYGESGTIDVDISGLPTGNHTIQVTHELVADPYTVYNTETHDIEIFQTTKAITDIYVDKHRRLIVNGSPFFMRGIYTNDSPDASALTALKAIGFNTIVDYSLLAGGEYELTAPVKAKIAANYAEGFYTIFNLKDIHSGSTTPNDWGGGGTEGVYATAEEAQNAITYLINTFKDEVGVLGWYINDENEGVTYGDEFADTYAQCKSLSPHLPVFQNMYSIQDLTKIIPSCDCISLNCYPSHLGTTDLVWNAQSKRLRDDANGANYLFMVPECATVDSPHPNSPPTTETMLTRAYSALSHEARGFIWFGNGTAATCGLLHDGAGQVTEITDALTHLAGLEEFAAGLDTGISVTSNCYGISCYMRLVDGDYYIVASNSNAAAAVGNFEIGREILVSSVSILNVPALDEASSITLSHNAWTEVLAAGATRLYKATLGTITRTAASGRATASGRSDRS